MEVRFNDRRFSLSPTAGENSGERSRRLSQRMVLRNAAFTLQKAAIAERAFCSLKAAFRSADSRTASTILQTRLEAMNSIVGVSAERRKLLFGKMAALCRDAATGQRFMEINRVACA